MAPYTSFVRCTVQESADHNGWKYRKFIIITIFISH